VDPTPDPPEPEVPVAEVLLFRHAQGLTPDVIGVAEAFPPALVYIGFSLGVLPAQKLAQTRSGARGAVLFHSAIPITGEWGLRAVAGRRAGPSPRHGQ
jgi:hypothetical protein